MCASVVAEIQQNFGRGKCFILPSQHLFPFLGMLLSGISAFLSKPIGNLQEPSMDAYSEMMCITSQLQELFCFVSSFWVWDLCGPVAFSQAVWGHLIIPKFVICGYWFLQPKWLLVWVAITSWDEVL